MTVVIDHLAKPRPRHPEKQARPDTPLLRKPEWLRVRAPGSEGYAQTRNLVKANGLVTVCEEAACPNIGECWSQSHATMMIMGEICTRACAFCNVTTGKPNPLDPTEPARVAEAAQQPWYRDYFPDGEVDPTTGEIVNAPGTLPGEVAIAPCDADDKE